MFRNADGELCVWDRVVPNYTIFHADDCTFSDCWTDFSDDFGTFYRAVTADMQTFGGNHGIKAKPGPRRTSTACPARHGSRSPAAAARVTGSSEPAFFPIIVMGRYEESGGAVRMPVALSIAHAVADGYHAALFFRYLQEEMDALAASEAGL